MAVLLLLLPWAADVPWTASDFIFAGILIGGVGAALELTVWMRRNYAYRAGIAAALAAALLILWASGAVGMIGSEDNPYNLLFLGVIGIAVVGAVIARFRPVGTAVAVAAAAAAQVGVAVGGLPTDPRGGILSAMFAGLWLMSAMLLGKAARTQ